MVVPGVAGPSSLTVSGMTFFFLDAVSGYALLPLHAVLRGAWCGGQHHYDDGEQQYDDRLDSHFQSAKVVQLSELTKYANFFYHLQQSITVRMQEFAFLFSYVSYLIHLLWQTVFCMLFDLLHVPNLEKNRAVFRTCFPFLLKKRKGLLKKVLSCRKNAYLCSVLDEAKAGGLTACHKKPRKEDETTTDNHPCLGAVSANVCR